MKNALITILIILVTAAIFLYFWTKNLLKKLTFGAKPDFSKLNFIDINASLAGVEFPVNVSILNRSKYELNIKQLDLELYYNGTRVGQTIEKHDLNVQKRTNNEYSIIFYMENNAATRQLIKDYLAGKELNLELKTDFKVLNGTIGLKYTELLTIKNS